MNEKKALRQLSADTVKIDVPDFDDDINGGSDCSTVPDQ